MQVTGSTYEGLLIAETYLVGPPIAFGGMGAVHQASHVRLPKRFAIKFLDPGYRKNGESYARFQREAEIASNLGHPNIAQVVDFNTLPDGAPYIVMELLEGEDLRTRLARGKLTVAEVLRLSTHLASALTAAHKLGVVHRDLKPDNVFLCNGDDGFTVKVLDFGVSKIRGAMKSLTGDKAVFGTPAYMSPEQARGDVEKIDHRSDVYGMGAVLYEALSGVPVYDGENAFEILTKLATERPKPLIGYAPTVDAVLQRALAIDPTDRFDSVKELHKALVLALTGQRVQTTPVRGTPAVDAKAAPVAPVQTLTGLELTPHPGRPRRSRALLWVSVTAGLAAAVAVVYLGGRTDEPASPAAVSPVRPAPVAPAPAPSPAPPEEVVVTIDLTPSGARLELDGRPVTSPLRLARSSDRHVLKASAPGHVEQTISMVADRDRELRVRLERRVAKQAKRQGKPGLVGGAEL